MRVCRGALRHVFTAIGLAATMAACAGGPVGQGGQPLTPAATVPTAGQAAPSAAPDLPNVPVDASLTAVSRSNPGRDAQAVIDLCVRPGDLDAIAGMAQLPSAQDVKKYMLTNGHEPELKDDVPVWMVQFKGPIKYRWGTAFNPVCVVKDGISTIYVPYGTAEHPDESVPSDFKEATLALPPLAP